MTKRTPKLFINISLFLALTLGIVYASNTAKSENINQEMDYKNMSTTQLQIQVEKLSNQGDLPFQMGLELMNRWTVTNKEVN